MMNAKVFSKLSEILTRHPLGLGDQDFPKWLISVLTRQIPEYLKLRRALSRLKRMLKESSSFEEDFRILQTESLFRTDQKQFEIVNLLTILAKDPPKFVCEIGTASGGTLFLLARICQPDAVVVSIDLGLPFPRAFAYSRFAMNGQKVICIRENSRSPEVLAKVQSVLRGNKLDLLFIDGDHSYDGVSTDFKNYFPLVRKGGLVAFHDIVPDFRTRFGINTEYWTGEVPKFWSELQNNFKTEQFIEDPNQDGYGIGLIRI